MATDVSDQPFGQLAYGTIRILAENSARKSASTGTGFIFTFSKSGKYYELLITNRHVIDGADSLSFTVHRKTSAGTLLAGPGETLRLATSELLVMPHPDPKLDLVAIHLGAIRRASEALGWTMFYGMAGPEGLATPEEVAEFDVVEEVFMLGYPAGLWDTANNMPIFRRGVTATSYRMNYRGAPEFLIDLAVYPGSSGSPVFYHKKQLKGEPGALREVWNIRLIGVLFAGHVQTDSGVVVAEPAPTGLGRVDIKHMINLGICIKADQLLAFAPPDWLMS